MIKRLTLFLLIMFCASNICRSQDRIDTIFTTKQDTISCLITLVNSINIFYTYDKNKSTFISRNKVDHFILHSTAAEIIDKPTTEKPTNKDSLSINSPSEVLYSKGQADAIKYYDDAGPGTCTLVISLLSPLAGLIPAIACSSTQPKDKNLNFHNSELIKNLDYHNGYVHSAMKIKKKKVWTNWGIAFGINFIATIIIYSKN